MNEEQIRIILGNEYDDALREALRIVLMRNGAVGMDKFWGIGGSQEIEILKVKLGGSFIVIESETFVGLTVSGPRLVVDGIAQQVLQQLSG